MIANIMALEAFERSHTHSCRTEDLIYIQPWTRASAPYAYYLAPIELTRIFLYDQNRSETLCFKTKTGAAGLQLLVVHKNTDVLDPAELLADEGF